MQIKKHMEKKILREQMQDRQSRNNVVREDKSCTGFTHAGL